MDSAPDKEEKLFVPARKAGFWLLTRKPATGRGIHALEFAQKIMHQCVPQMAEHTQISAFLRLPNARLRRKASTLPLLSLENANLTNIRAT